MENHSNINNQFIPYELALELKELGFDEPCFAFYGLSRDDYKTIRLSIFQNLKTDYLPDIHHLDVTCDAPLYQQGINFLLNKLNGHYCITFYKDETGYITDNRVDYLEYDFENFTECLKKLINIIK